MAKKCGVDEMAAEISNILKEWRDGIENVTEESVRAATNAARNDVRARSPRSGDRPRSASYAQHWRTSFDFRGRVRKGIVYNTKAPLTHLLEFGHAYVNGGRYSGVEHIGSAQEAAAENFEKILKEGIEKA